MSTASTVALACTALLLGACARAPVVTSTTDEAGPAAAETIPAGSDPFAPRGNTLTRVDEQGAIAVEVTPLNMDNAAEKMEFDVALNTHSVDLSMDLAQLSILTTDTGLRLEASLWDAPLGGHHTRGTLVFPLSIEALRLLDEASRLTLTISDLDVASRTFEWELR